MGANRQAMRLRFVIETVSATIAYMPKNLSSISIFLDCNYLNSHWHCPLARKATDNLSAIDNFGDVRILSRYFSD
jgi:hypothetical protein